MARGASPAATSSGCVTRYHPGRLTLILTAARPASVHCISAALTTTGLAPALSRAASRAPLSTNTRRSRPFRVPLPRSRSAVEGVTVGGASSPPSTGVTGPCHVLLPLKSRSSR